MNNVKDWWVRAQDKKMPLQDRMFRVMVMVGLVSLAFAICFGFVLEEDIGAVLILAAGWIILFFIAWISITRNRVAYGVMWVATILEFVVVPISFFTGGALYGGAPIWFVFLYAYTALLMRGKARTAFFIANTLCMLACYVEAYTHPEWVSHHTSRVAYMDSFACMIVLSAQICIMIIFQINIYHSQWNEAEHQRQEIFELNKAQNRFFSSMSHEIRTPINTIIGLNEMNLRENLSDEVAENSVHIQQSSRILLSLINDILDMSKIESGKMNIIATPYVTGDMLSDVVGMAWNLARDKHLEFNITVDETLPQKLIGDEVRIKQILINLLTNAIKYTREGSVTLNIQQSLVDEDHTVVTYSVSDTGIGIKRENLPHLFSAFRREDEKNNQFIEGTGLGLNIVKQLVDLMGGEITVNSIYTKGSVFNVSLPQQIEDISPVGALSFDRRNALNRHSDYHQKFEAPGARVLIVDDNEVNLMVEEKLLRNTKMQVESVTSGEECLRKTLEGKYDIIFMDHLMPEMDGIECLHRLRVQPGGQNHETPVIVLTANAGSDLMAMYRREGFDDYIMKPIQTDLMEDRLLAHLSPALISETYTDSISDREQLTNSDFQRKRGIVICTESVCDLPKNLIDAQKIGIISYNIYTEKGYFQDGKEIEAEGILAHINDPGHTARAVEPSVEVYERFFADQLERAQHIIHISASKKINPAYSRAREAAELFSNITVVDSGHLSCGMGMVVLYASRLVDSGEPLNKIIPELERYSAFVRTSFCLDSMTLLAKSGRVPKHALKMSDAFMLHPVVEMTNGIMKPRRMVLGSREKAWKVFISSSFRKSAQVDRTLLFIAYSGLSGAELSEIKEEVAKYIEFDKIILQKVSAASAAIFGPGTFGLLYRMNL